MKFTPREYQRDSLAWLANRTIVQGHEGAGLVHDPGLGKTAQTLSFIRLLKMMEPGLRVLIVGPRRVIDLVWTQEIEEWDQFTFSTSTIHGGSGVSGEVAEARRIEALESPADIHLVNTDGVVWLSSYLKKKKKGVPFDLLIVDESSAFKTWGSDRTQSLLSLVKAVPRRLILTGTPLTNSLEDLFPQIWIIDRGATLGKNVTAYRERWFQRGGFKSYKWIEKPEAREEIEALVAPMLHRLEANEHLDLPERLFKDLYVQMPPEALKVYKDLERDLFLLLNEEELAGLGRLDPEDNEYAPTNAGVKYLACRQLASGALYVNTTKDRKIEAKKRGVPLRDIPKIVSRLHREKLKALKEIQEETQGPLLVAYNFEHELQRLLEEFPEGKVINGTTSSNEARGLVEGWNRGKVSLLFVQPQSLSHGVNMQKGTCRNLVWFSLTDNLEHYLQFIARVHRQGVKASVTVWRIICKDTVEEAVRDNLDTKETNQAEFLEVLNQYRKSQQ